MKTITINIKDHRFLMNRNNHYYMLIDSSWMKNHVNIEEIGYYAEKNNIFFLRNTKATTKEEMEKEFPTVLSYNDSLNLFKDFFQNEILKAFQTKYFSDLDKCDKEVIKDMEEKFAKRDLTFYKECMCTESKFFFMASFSAYDYFEDEFILDNYEENDFEVVEKAIQILENNPKAVLAIQEHLIRSYLLEKNLQENPINDNFLRLAKAIKTTKAKNVKVVYDCKTIIDFINSDEFKTNKNVEETYQYFEKDADIAFSALKEFCKDKDTITLTLNKFDFKPIETSFMGNTDYFKVVMFSYDGIVKPFFENFLPAIKEVTYRGKAIYTR